MTRHRQVMRKGWRPLVALAASWLLVLQVLLTGLTVAGHAIPAGAEGFAAAICTADGIRPAPGHPDAPADRHDLTCCLIGCSATVTGAAPPPAAAIAFRIAATAARAAPAPADRAIAGLRFSPSSARAPPPTA